MCRTDYPSRLISQERRIILIVITSERERETRTASRQGKGLFRAGLLISPLQKEKAWVVNVFSLSPSVPPIFLTCFGVCSARWQKGASSCPGTPSLITARSPYHHRSMIGPHRPRLPRGGRWDARAVVNGHFLHKKKWGSRAKSRK